MHVLAGIRMFWKFIIGQMHNLAYRICWSHCERCPALCFVVAETCLQQQANRMIAGRFTTLLRRGEIIHTEVVMIKTPGITGCWSS